MPELVVDHCAPAPDYPTFVLALRDPFTRSAIGVHISDEDAELLLRRSDWSLTFYRQWTGERIDSERGAPIALPRVLAVPAPSARESARRAVVVPDAPVERPRTLRVAAVAVAIGTVLAAGIVGTGIVQAGATAGPAASPSAVADPFPPGLAGPSAPAGAVPSGSASAPPSGSREDRLGADLTAALKLDERTAAVPAVSGIVRAELVHVADLACLQGYDDTMAGQIAQAVSGRPDLDTAAGDAVADSIARYCASAPTG